MTNAALRIAALLGARVVKGPLKGFHNEVFAIELPLDNSFTFQLLKLSEHRPGVVWFDLRFFPSQHDLLERLLGLVPRIPEVVRIQGIQFHHFIDGETLESRAPAGCPVEAHHIGQIVELFRRMVSVPPASLPLSRTAHGAAWPRDRDSTGFLRRMVEFTRRDVYERHLERYGHLFQALRVPGDSLAQLAETAGRLTPRPFSLLHGDLHRDNFIVTDDGVLWTIDWELAMIGDPLYDLATHLHLMHYPPDQAAWVTSRWREAAERARPGASLGLEQDLPRYLAYKRVQSVYTDIIREADGLRSSGGRARLSHIGVRVKGLLDRAGPALGMSAVPSAAHIASVYGRWYRADIASRPESVPA
jgi:hypothetical protein